MNPEPVDKQQPAARENALLRLGAIENHLDHIDARLATISEFNGRLDEIHTTLETVIGFMTPDRILESITEPSTHADDDSPSCTGYRVVAHLSRDNGGTQLVPDVSWPDAWSVRLFVTALLRNLTRTNPVQQRRRCWCEVWTPDETGEFVDSAILNPDTGAIEWESDITPRTEPS
jgi:hypothetical protein